MKLHFYIRFHTHFRQSLWITGDTDALGNREISAAVPMHYLDNEYWHCVLESPHKSMPDEIRYKYLLRNEADEWIRESGFDKFIVHPKKNVREIHLIDSWNAAGFFENVFFTSPFRNVLLKTKTEKIRSAEPKKVTHIFRVKAPLLKKNETVCLLGSGNELRDWSTDKPILLSKNDEGFEIKLNLGKENFPIEYKYGIYNTKEKKFAQYENGNNRIVYSDTAKKKLTILHDGFVYLPNNTWKGGGVAIPVFSLRSKNSFGVGEFTDIKLLLDWAKKTGLKLIQLLPINDTTATHTNADSYPYAAISAYALHPLYIDLFQVAGEEYAEQISILKKKQKELNALKDVDYEQVIRLKFSVLKELYKLMGETCFASDDYKKFFTDNQHWLIPYAAFCFLRDKYGTSHFEKWEEYKIYNKEEIEKFTSPGAEYFPEIAFHFFVQYHLHCQLKDAVDHAHKKGVVVKGDLPIGMYRYGCDVWMNPELFDMGNQLGAPPDDFSIKGQNWSFPAYNWKRMREDGFAWWKQRFSHLSIYFDAFRIDHILGFFRTWNIPADAVEGIMGRFEPSVPVDLSEFGEYGIWLDYQRYCKPFITDKVLNEIFGEQSEYVKENFLMENDHGGYDLLPEFSTQRKVEKYFCRLDNTEENSRLKIGLYDLISNVILFEEQGSQGERFHFRLGMERTTSFKHLIPFVREKIYSLYINYFYRRQEDTWRKEALSKLPQLKATTEMLVCGEDLGMVPHCVPDVMKELGILSLEIQRMPKLQSIEFFHPDNAPYLSVVSPSTHDMSTIRGWWEEDTAKSQRFFNNMLGQHGEAPTTCQAWINRAIILQHLYSPAIWSIFQLQDIIGMSETLRRENPHEERINVPADVNHLWNYRMHINLEDLIKAKEFNEELKGYVTHSGR